MSTARRVHRYTYADYVAVEADSDIKHEFLDGEIPSLRDYIVVSHRERRITVHSRTAEGSWVARTAIAGGRVSVPSVNAELSVDEIYRLSSIT